MKQDVTNTSAVSSPQVFHEFHMTRPLFLCTSQHYHISSNNTLLFECQIYIST